MKKNILIGLLIMSGSFFILNLNSCKKKDEERAAKETVCTPVSYVSHMEGLNDSIVTTIEYNSDGKVLRVKTIITGLNEVLNNTSYDYNTNGFITEFDTSYNGANNMDITENKYKIGSNGYASQQVRISKTINNGSLTGQNTDTTYYEYSSDGYLLKEFNSKSSTNYTITAGNITFRISKNIAGATIDSVLTEYYSDKNNSVFDNQNLILGKESTNLKRKELKYTPGYKEITDYTYEIDNSGKVTRVTTAIDYNGTIRNNFMSINYNCQ